MENAVNTFIQGIKCDNPDCTFKDISVPFTDYQNYVNKPCPECGMNLLTEEDYKTCLLIKRYTELANKLIKNPEQYETKGISVNLHGNDTADIHVYPAKERE